jgi:hypothetical protein
MSARAGALALLLAAPSLAAQSMRDFDYARPLRNEKQLRAVVEFAAGRILIRPGTSGKLYGLEMQYDADRFRPIGHFNAGAAEVHLGVEGTGSGGIRVDLRRALPQTAVVEFPGSVDLSLDVSVGAADGTLELGGLRLSDLEVKIGASHTAIGFKKPNEGNCRSASVTTGAGELELTDAGNSGCRSWRLDGGVGAMTLDLGGSWPADARMTISTALGGVRLIAPKDLGLRVRVSGFLAGFDASGFTKTKGTYTSSNYAAAARHVDIEVSSAIGGVSVVWK